jgi:4-hydroxy-tetrahydrodipicolinate synthase
MSQTNNIKNKIIGPIFSVITPFKKNGDIDYINLKKYLKFLYIRGARVFYVMFYNSRLGLLTEKEVINLNLFVAKYLKKNFKHVIVIGAEPYHCSTNDSLKIASIFKKNNIDVLSVIFGEKFYNDKQIINHFTTISKKSKIKLLLHQQLLENGISSNPSSVKYNINVLKKISKLSNFIAMKEDAKIDNYTKKILTNVKKNINIITSGGGKKQWMKFAKQGCQGWLSGISNLDPKIAIQFYKFYKDNEIHKCLKIIKYLEEPFFKLKDKFGWHLTIKASLEVLKLMSRHERKPMISLKNNQMKEIKKMIKKIKFNSEKYFKEYNFFVS